MTNKLDQAGAEILRYQYDANNRLTNRWSAAKGNTAYTHDPAGNSTFINYPSSPDVTFSWDWLNRLTNMVDASGTNRYTYTAGNQLLTEDGPWTTDDEYVPQQDADPVGPRSAHQLLDQRLQIRRRDSALECRHVRGDVCLHL